MKRLVYAVVIAAMVAFAGSAQAIKVYEKDGLTFQIKGDWQIQLRQDIGHEQDLDVEYDDLELKNSVVYDLQNGLSAFGELDFGFKNAADKSNDDEAPHLEEAYLGFKFQDVKFLYGKTNSAGDEFGIAGTIETVVADDVFDEVGAVDGDDLLLISAKVAGMVNIVASYELEAESESSDGNGTFYDIFVGVEFAGVEIGAAYQNYEASASDEDIDLYGVSVAYDAKVVKVAADYSVADDIQTIWNLFVEVPVQTFTFGAGYVNQDFDDDAEEDVSGWYANVKYQFPAQKNVSIFAEIGDDDVDGHDVGYLFGTRIKF